MVFEILSFVLACRFGGKPCVFRFHTISLGFRGSNVKFALDLLFRHGNFDNGCLFLISNDNFLVVNGQCVGFADGVAHYVFTGAVAVIRLGCLRHAVGTNFDFADVVIAHYDVQQALLDIHVDGHNAFVHVG